MKGSVTILFVVLSLSVSLAQTGSKFDILNVTAPIKLQDQVINLQLCGPVLGAVCKLENRQSNKKLFTYRSRLGNLDYVNGLEGK